MKRSELYSELDKRFAPSYSCDWDNDGVMVCADGERDVKRVLVSLDVSAECVKRAVLGGFDLIVSHHPLIFRPLKRLRADILDQKKVIDLIKNDVALFSFHTRMDSAPGGLNDRVARYLGMENVLGVSLDGEGGVPARIGDVKERSPREFAQFVSDAFGAPVRLYDSKRPVKRVFSVSGGGRDFIFKALESGADAFVSGDLGYNDVLDALEAGMSVIELDHYSSEILCCDVFSELIDSLDPGINVESFTGVGSFTQILPR